MKLAKRINYCVALCLLSAFFFVLGVIFISQKIKAIVAFTLGGITFVVLVFYIFRVVKVSVKEKKIASRNKVFLDSVDLLKGNFQLLTHEVIEGVFEERIRNNELIFNASLSYDVVTGFDSTTKLPVFFVRLKLKKGNSIFLSCDKDETIIFNLEDETKKELKSFNMNELEYNQLIKEIVQEIEKVV